jgi:hypothetical protein
LLNTNTYNFYESRGEYVPYEKKVTINRAPTDESIKLYDEMVEKAERSFLDRFKLNTTAVDIVVAVFDRSHLGGLRVHYVLRLNGKIIQDGFDVLDPYRNRVQYQRDNIIEQLYHEVSQKIVYELRTSVRFQSAGL